VDVGRKLNNHLKITGISDSMIRAQELSRKQQQTYSVHWPFWLCYTLVKFGSLK